MNRNLDNEYLIHVLSEDNIFTVLLYLHIFSPQPIHSLLRGMMKRQIITSGNGPIDYTTIHCCW